MKIKRTTDELLEQDYMSLMWKQWLCWSKIILIGLKTFRINGKLIISNFTSIVLQCQRFFQINSYFLHKRGLQIVIAENTSLLSEQPSFCLWNWISSPFSTALFHWTLKQCTVGWDNGEETPGLRGCAHKVPSMLPGTLVCLRTMLTEPGVLEGPGK